MATPVINVNLRRCEHPDLSPVDERGWHKMPSGNFLVCHAGAPVHIPCPLPRMVEFTVRLGECCGCAGEFRAAPENHMPSCPAHPVRVTCPIAGETWEHSKPIVFTMPDGSEAPTVIADACRERWALVKALVLGRDEEWRNDPKSEGWNLQPQRDTEFAALAKLVQAEQAAVAAQAECDAAFPIDNYVKVPAPDHRSEPRPSTVRLAAFVAHLIASVGTL